MLNEERIKLMTKLALYEQKEGKKDIPMSRYYKGDYVSYHMIRSGILATIGFLLCVAVWFAFHLSYFMEENNIVKLDVMTAIGKNVLIIYILFMAAYQAITYVVYATRFIKVRENLKQYNGNLKKLNKMYQREDRMKEELETGGLDNHDDIVGI